MHPVGHLGNWREMEREGTGEVCISLDDVHHAVLESLHLMYNGLSVVNYQSMMVNLLLRGRLPY